MVFAAAKARYNRRGFGPFGAAVARKSQKNRAPTIYVLNGPNLNLLGTREPEIYGHTTLPEIGRMVAAKAKDLGLKADFRQTNSEGQLIDWLQEARENAAGVILNAAGLTHTSVAVLDACRTLEKPLIEVHLSNPYAREGFRRKSFISQAATGVICGLGANGYLYAMEALAQRLKGGAP
jgi:3-dehydroquinate dehydratase-2